MMDSLFIWETMKRIRMVEEAIANKYSEQKMRCPTHLSIGQELPAAILSMLLSPEDNVVSGHRAHAHYLAKGGDLRKLIAELYGKETGCCRGIGGSMHLIDLSVNFLGSSAIVGNIIPVGAGAAYSSKLRGSNAWSFICLGDGAIEEGVFYETANFAVLKNLNVVFFCENNDFSVYTHIVERQPAERKIHEMAGALGLRALKLDFTNCLEAPITFVNQVKSLMIDDGPIFIEIETWRYREHCGPNFDDHLGYRDEKSIKNFKENDPLELFYERLSQTEKNIEFMQHREREISLEIADAFEFSESSEHLTFSQLGELEYSQDE